MPEQSLTLLWGIEKRLTWAQNIQAACDAFTARTGLQATHIYTAPTKAPPDDCKLTWRGTISVSINRILVGVEMVP